MGLALLLGCCLFLEEGKGDRFRTRILYLTCSGQTLAKEDLQRLMGLKGFKPILDGCRALREAGMGWQTEGLNKWPTGDNVSMISWHNQWGNQVWPNSNDLSDGSHSSKINGCSSAIWYCPIKQNHIIPHHFHFYLYSVGNWFCSETLKETYCVIFRFIILFSGHY